VKKLDLDPALVTEARERAARIAEPVERMIEGHTTEAIERAVLRLCGLDGAVGEGVDARPFPNLVIEAVRDQVGLGRGVAVPVFDLMIREALSIEGVAQRVVSGEARFRWPEDPGEALGDVSYSHGVLEIQLIRWRPLMQPPPPGHRRGISEFDTVII
jgi:beta-lysine 5,6-aminomutase alpha subunit